jgi:hypothetical protein
MVGRKPRDINGWGKTKRKIVVGKLGGKWLKENQGENGWRKTRTKKLEESQDHGYDGERKIKKNMIWMNRVNSTERRSAQTEVI